MSLSQYFTVTVMAYWLVSVGIVNGRYSHELLAPGKALLAHLLVSQRLMLAESCIRQLSKRRNLHLRCVCTLKCYCLHSHWWLRFPDENWELRKEDLQLFSILKQAQRPDCFPSTICLGILPSCPSARPVLCLPSSRVSNA